MTRSTASLPTSSPRRAALGRRRNDLTVGMSDVRSYNGASELSATLLDFRRHIVDPHGVVVVAAVVGIGARTIALRRGGLQHACIGLRGVRGVARSPAPGIRWTEDVRGARARVAGSVAEQPSGAAPCACDSRTGDPQVVQLRGRGSKPGTKLRPSTMPTPSNSLASSRSPRSTAH